MTEQVPFCSPLACGCQDAFVLLLSLALHRDKALGSHFRPPQLFSHPRMQVKAQFSRLLEKEEATGSSTPPPPSPPVSTALRPSQQNHKEESPGTWRALSHSCNVPLGPTNNQSALFVDAPNDSGETKQRSQRAKPICVRICLSFSFPISSCQSLSSNAPDLQLIT